LRVAIAFLAVFPDNEAPTTGEPRVPQTRKIETLLGTHPLAEVNESPFGLKKVDFSGGIIVSGLLTEITEREVVLKVGDETLRFRYQSSTPIWKTGSTFSDRQEIDILALEAFLRQNVMVTVNDDNLYKATTIQIPK